MEVKGGTLKGGWKYERQKEKNTALKVLRETNRPQHEEVQSRMFFYWCSLVVARIWWWRSCRWARTEEDVPWNKMICTDATTCGTLVQRMVHCNSQWIRKYTASKLCIQLSFEVVLRCSLGKFHSSYKFRSSETEWKANLKINFHYCK